MCSHITVPIPTEPIRFVTEVYFQDVPAVAATHYVQLGRWFWCYHCRVIIRQGPSPDHYCGAPWQTRPDDIPDDWIPLQHPEKK